MNKTIAYPLRAVAETGRPADLAVSSIRDANDVAVTGWGAVLNEPHIIEEIVTRANSHEALKSVVVALIHNHKFGNVWPEWLPEKGFLHACCGWRNRVTESLVKIEEKFNLKSAALLDVQSPVLHSGRQYALGIKVTFFQPSEMPDGRRTIAMHMTPLEALEFAENLIAVARKRITNT